MPAYICSSLEYDMVNDQLYINKKGFKTICDVLLRGLKILYTDFKLHCTEKLLCHKWLMHKYIYVWGKCREFF